MGRGIVIMRSVVAGAGVALILLVGGVAHAAEVDEVSSASDVISPAAPTHLTYTEGYSPLYGALPGVLEWAPATDDVTDSYDIGYRLYHDGQLVTLFGTLLGGYGRHSVNFYDEVLVCWNLLPDGWYTVTAIDQAGNESAPSEPIMIVGLA